MMTEQGPRPRTDSPCIGWLLEFYILATSKVISGLVPICHRVHSWLLCNAAQLGNQITGTMTRYPTQSHYPDTELALTY